MTESSNESFRPYQVAFDAYRKDLYQVCAISERLVASATGIDNDPIKDTEKLEKLKTIKSQMLKLRETRNEARNRYDAAIDEADAKGVQDIRGLCAYAEGTGQSSAGIRYLLEECKAFDAAKGDFKLRRALHGQIVNIVASVADAVEKQKGIVSPDASVLAEFESITDPEYSTAFWKQHQEAIQRQLQARIDSQNNIN